MSHGDTLVEFIRCGGRVSWESPREGPSRLGGSAQDPQEDSDHREGPSRLRVGPGAKLSYSSEEWPSSAPSDTLKFCLSADRHHACSTSSAAHCPQELSSSEEALKERSGSEQAQLAPLLSPSVRS